jgi:hypothetical protein
MRYLMQCWTNYSIDHAKQIKQRKNNTLNNVEKNKGFTKCTVAERLPQKDAPK